MLQLRTRLPRGQIGVMKRFSVAAGEEEGVVQGDSRVFVLGG